MNDPINDLIQQLSQESPPPPVRKPWVLGLQLWAFALVYLGVSLLISGTRSDLSTMWHTGWFTIEIILLASLTISSGYSVVLLGYPDLYQKQPWVYLPAAFFVIFVLFLLLAWQWAPYAPEPVHSWQCCLSIVLLSIVPTSVAFYGTRQLACTHPRAAGIASTLFAFALAAIWLRLYEHTDSYWHLLTWHYFPLLLLMALGAWLGSKYLRW